MPGWLRAYVDVNPVSHLVTTERALMNGTAAAGQVGWVLLARPRPSPQSSARSPCACTAAGNGTGRA